MREDEAVDSFASMFQTGYAAEPERIVKRQRAERRSSQTAKQRKRGGSACAVGEGEKVQRRGIAMRWVYIGAGLLALSASSYMAVMASGGIHSASAPALIAMAVILAVGAASIGHALAGRHMGIAIVIGLGMLAGECGAMIQTAQRVTAAREASRAPMVALELKRKAALDELESAQQAKPLPMDPSRLAAAEIAKVGAEKAVREKSAEKGCRENCRLLLQSAVGAAQREVEAAREAVTRRELDQLGALTKRIEIAKAVVAALPPPQSATPLADYTGVPEWLYDVLEALALSLAINLPASALIALGVKMGREQQIVEAPCENGAPIAHELMPFSEAVSNENPRLSSPKARRRNPDDEAEQFGVAMLRPGKEGRVSPRDLRAAYVGWCEKTDKEPLPIEEIAPALGKLFRNAGIEMQNGHAVGVKISQL